MKRGWGGGGGGGGENDDTQELQANSGAARCPRDPEGKNHLSRAVTEPSRYYLEGRTLPGLLSPPTLAVARAARAGTHPGLSPSTHHTRSLARTAWREYRAARLDGNLGSDHTGSGPGSRVDTPSPPSPHSPPSCSPLLIHWIHALQSLFP